MALAVSVRLFALAFCAGILLSAVSTTAFADDRCAQLIALDASEPGRRAIESFYRAVIERYPTGFREA